MATCGSLDSTKDNCANTTQMEQLWTDSGNEIYASVMVVTPIVQPDQHNPVVTFIEDSNFLIFGKKVAQKMDIEIAEYEIETDHSLLPFRDLEVNEGAMLSGVSKNYNLNQED